MHEQTDKVFYTKSIADRFFGENTDNRAAVLLEFFSSTLQKMWWLSLVFLPSSPFLHYLNENLLYTLILAAMLFAPHFVTMFFSDRLSSNSSLTIVTFVALLAINLTLFFDNPFIKAALYSISLWGLDLACVPLNYHEQRLRSSLLRAGLKYLCIAIGFALISLCSLFYHTAITFYVIPIFSRGFGSLCGR